MPVGEGASPVRVLLTGANGFIGGHVAAALQLAGHQVVAAVREPCAYLRRWPAGAAVRCDLNRDHAPGDWAPRLHGIDAVVNCAGILRERRGQTHEAVHVRAPKALFEAAVAAGVKRLIQISAISADAEAGTAFALTKKRADDHLRELDAEWVVVRPSLVYAAGSYGGTSFLRGLAGLPFVVPLIGQGDQRFQPIHADDVARTVVALLEPGAPTRAVIEPVGPETLSVREIVAKLRRWLGLRPARFIPIPMALVEIVARLGDLLGNGPVTTTALRQLAYGNVGDPSAFARAIGFQPRSMDHALAQRPAQTQDLWHARLYFLRPALRAALAAMWLLSGLSGLLAPLATSTPYLAALGIPDSLAAAFAYGTGALDLGIGVLVALAARPLAVGLVQLVAVAAYTLALTVAQPDLWLDLFGPLAKNLPILAAIAVLMALDRER